MNRFWDLVLLGFGCNREDTKDYDKLLIKERSVKFFGNIYSAERVRANPKKVAAIADMRPLESKANVKSFLGMVNKFVPRLSEYSKLLKSL